jgi:hypothetical protein
MALGIQRALLASCYPIQFYYYRMAGLGTRQAGASTLVAHLAMGLEEGVLWVWIFNIIVFILVDLLKGLFKRFINEEAGETIDVTSLSK